MMDLVFSSVSDLVAFRYAHMAEKTSDSGGMITGISPANPLPS